MKVIIITTIRPECRMPIRSSVNQYLGANAHFLSYCQSSDKTKRKRWEGFHNAYIVKIQETLGSALEPYGYVVDNVTSLQVRERDPEASHEPNGFYLEKSDAGVFYDPEPDHSYLTPVSNRAMLSGTLTLPIPETFRMDETRYLHALAVRDVRETDDFNKIVAWIEVLSPSNKLGGADARDYVNKRLTLVAAEIPLIEIDLLHKQLPVIEGIPVYRPGRGQATDAKPYSISVTDPRPDVQFGGYTEVFSFAVDKPFPVVPVPLLSELSHPFDFGVPFNQTFALPVHYRVVDYEQLPEDFETYQTPDRIAVQNRMRVVQLHAHELDHGPFPVSDSLPLNTDNPLLDAPPDALER